MLETRRKIHHRLICKNKRESEQQRRMDENEHAERRQLNVQHIRTIARLYDEGIWKKYRIKQAHNHTMAAMWRKETAKKKERTQRELKAEVVDKQCSILLTVIVVTQSLRYGASRTEKSRLVVSFLWFSTRKALKFCVEIVRFVISPPRAFRSNRPFFAHASNNFLSKSRLVSRHFDSHFSRRVPEFSLSIVIGAFSSNRHLAKNYGEKRNDSDPMVSFLFF